ncbi:DUF481 domain-containing protein [candidate division KSB1 bacterium]|nr:DUF481 domain-containing protein [candidate division KSB1 bacterium]
MFRNGLMTFTILLFVSTSAFAQVNTEAMRNTALKGGFAYALSFNQQFARGNSDYSIYKSSGRIDFLHKKYHTFLIGNFKWGKQQDTKFINKGFVHGRIVFQVKDWLAPESFAQIEYDDFIRLKRRQLIGAGLRWKVWGQKKDAGWHMGTGFMRELEEYTVATEGTKALFRSTNYISGKLKLNEVAEWNLIVYYQVDVGHISDFRILVDSGLTIKLWKAVSLTINFESRDDNEPLPDVKKQDMLLTNGLQIKF